MSNPKTGIEPQRRVIARQELAARVSHARTMVDACRTQLEELEMAAKTWRVRWDHPEGIYLRNFLNSFRTFYEMVSGLAYLIEHLDANSERLAAESERQSTKMIATMAHFESFVGTLRDDYHSNKLLGVERTVNNAVDRVTRRLIDTMSSFTKPPPPRDWRIKPWMMYQGGVILLFAILWIFSTILGDDYRFQAITLDRGLSECIHNREFGSGKKLFCPLADFSHNNGPRVHKLVNEIRRNSGLLPVKP